MIAKIWEKKNILILARNLNSGRSYLITAVKVRKSWKQLMVSSILPKRNKNLYPDHFPHKKMLRIVSFVLFFKKDYLFMVSIQERVLMARVRYM